MLANMGIMFCISAMSTSISSSLSIKSWPAHSAKQSLADTLKYKMTRFYSLQTWHEALQGFPRTFLTGIQYSHRMRSSGQSEPSRKKGLPRNAYGITKEECTEDPDKEILDTEVL
jgi:hypothetical protein